MVSLVKRTYDEVTECGNVVISAYGLEEAIKAYDLSLTDDIAYWVGRAAIAWGDVNEDGELN